MLQKIHITAYVIVDCQCIFNNANDTFLNLKTGSICADTFQRSFFEFAFCQFIEEDMCGVHHFDCPACSPDMLAVSCDGNRKLYRFSKSKGYKKIFHVK